MDEQEARDLEHETGNISPQESEMMTLLQEQIRRMTVGDHLATMVQSLAALAVRKMGMSEETLGEKDLPQAQLAIDAIAALLPVLSGSRSQEEATAYRNMISELRMAYVTASAQETQEAQGSSEAQE